MADHIPSGTAFCERCGTRVAVTPGAAPLVRCRRCGLYACGACRVERADRCLDWVAEAAPGRARARRGVGGPVRAGAAVTMAAAGAAGAVPISRPIAGRATARRRIGRPVTAVAAGAVLAANLLVGVVGSGRRASDGSGAVAGVVGVPASGQPSAPGAASGSPPASAAGGSSLAPTPAAPGTSVSLAVADPVARSWTDPFGVIGVQVLVAVRNPGPAWARVDPASSGYVVTDPAGSTVADGRFEYALPRDLAPGTTGYLVATMDAPFATADERLTAGATATGQVQAGPGATLGVDEVTAAAGDEGLLVTGRVTNDGDRVAEHVFAGAVVLDPGGHPLAAVYDLTSIASLAPAEVATFRTRYPATGTLDPARVGRVVAVAYDLVE